MSYHSILEAYSVSLQLAVEERDEARCLARTILEFFDGMGMRPDWESQYPWLKETEQDAKPPERDGPLLRV